MTKKKQVKKVPIKEPILKKNVKLPTGYDLYTQGVSYSLLSKFIVCRERFRLRTVESLVPTGRKEAMEFGTIFHKALELYAMGKTNSQIIAYFSQKSKKRRKGSRRQMEYDPLLCRIASMMLPHYQRFWKEVLAGIKYFESEQVFEFPYQCSIGKVVPLRGKRDEGFVKDGKIWLQENKTMGQVNEEKIVMTLSNMLQPMLYLLSFQNDHPGKPIGGILYNVIRKPMLKQGKKESDTAFVQRISDDIESRPEHYFKMFEIEISNKDIEDWRLRYLDPLICQICMWWESIAHNPFDPWVGKDGLPNPHHFIRPFGVFDPMSIGVGDYFSRVVQGHDGGLERDPELFPELLEDD